VTFLASRSLLDLSAFFSRHYGGAWDASYYPATGEVYVFRVREIGLEEESSAASPPSEGFESRRSVRERMDVRAQTRIRRFCAEYDLNELWTLTFRHVPDFADLSGLMAVFLRKVSRRVPVGPYVWVPEWGAQTGRLHLHIAVRDWLAAFVEVCESCATERRSKAPLPAGGDCLGCLWSHGFVGRPSGSSVSSGYISKYVAKDVSQLEPGLQRYRIAKGFPVRRLSLSECGSLTVESYTWLESPMKAGAIPIAKVVLDG
jgi:hypothetical protein